MTTVAVAVAAVLTDRLRVLADVAPESDGTSLVLPAIFLVVAATVTAVVVIRRGRR